MVLFMGVHATTRKIVDQIEWILDLDALITSVKKAMTGIFVMMTIIVRVGDVIMFHLFNHGLGQNVTKSFKTVKGAMRTRIVSVEIVTGPGGLRSASTEQFIAACNEHY